MTTREVELPGIGVKHTLELAAGEDLVVVQHRSGAWELARVDSEGSSTQLAQLTAREASELGRILGQGDVVEAEDRKQLLLEEFSIEWVRLEEGSPLVGQTLLDAGVRARTGVSVIAQLRSEGSLLNPPPDTYFTAGETVVVIGNREQVDAFIAMFAPQPDEN